jgi:hypothetical protein
MHKERRHVLPLLVCAILGACTYESEIQKVEEYSLAVLSPDGTRYAYLYHVMRFRRPTGLAKFPDGGIPFYLEDRVTLMQCHVNDWVTGVKRELQCRQPRVVQELPIRYKPRLSHMSISYTQLQWLTPDRIAYDMRSPSLVSGKGEVEIPRR